MRALRLLRTPVVSSPLGGHGHPRDPLDAVRLRGDAHRIARYDVRARAPARPGRFRRGRVQLGAHRGGAALRNARRGERDRCQTGPRPCAAADGAHAHVPHLRRLRRTDRGDLPARERSPRRAARRRGRSGARDSRALRGRDRLLRVADPAGAPVLSAVRLLGRTGAGHGGDGDPARGLRRGCVESGVGPGRRRRRLHRDALALAPYRVRPGFDRATAGSVCRSGWGFVLQGGVSFIEQNADYAVIGTTGGPRQLGLYSMAYRIAEIPNNFVVEPVAQATFPGFARMRERSEPVAVAFLTTLRLTTLLAFPLGVIAAGAAEPLVDAILGPRWNAMTGLLQILGLWGSLRIIQATIGWFVNAMGFSSSIGSAYAVLLAVEHPALGRRRRRGRAKGVAWVMVGNIVVMIGIVGTIAHRRIGIPGRRQWTAVRPCVIGAVPAALFAFGTATALAAAPPAVAAIAAVAAGLGAYAAAVSLLDRGLLTEGARGLRAVFARTRDARPRDSARIPGP